MIEEMNRHYSFTNPATLFDEEALTSLELAGRTASKMNETVKAFNELETETNAHLNAQDKEITDRMKNQDNRLTTMEKTQIPNTVTSEVNKCIQNGVFDTQIEEYTGGLNSRIDNLARLQEGSTSGDAELIDMRVSATGETYTSAGQVLRRYEAIIERQGYFELFTGESGKAVIDDGTIVNAENTYVTDFIPAINGTHNHLENVNLSNKRSVYGYHADKTPYKCLKTNTEDSTVDVHIPVDVYYIRTCGIPDKTVIASYNYPTDKYSPNYMAMVSTDFLNNCDCNFGINNVRAVNKGLALIPSSSSSYIPFENHAGNIWLKECEDVELLEFKVRTTSLNGTGQPIRFFVKNPNTDNFFFCTYTLKKLDDGSYTKAGTSYWYDKTYRQLEYTNAVEVTSQSVKTAIDQMIFNVQVRIAHGYVCIYVENVFMDKYKLPVTGKVIAGYNYRQPTTQIILQDMKVVNRKAASPYMHVSIDDVNLCLADLQTNKDNYTSIFDNAFLNKLRELRLKYGAVFTLNIFSNEAVNVANMTQKYRDEFKSCADWLKFAVHSEKSTDKYADYSDADMIASYKTVRQAIYNISGYECIDNIPRLGFFSAKKSALATLKNEGVGFLGCLTADDTRDSNCGLDVNERGIVNTMDSYIDLWNDLHFIKTTVRLDGKDEVTGAECFNTDYLDIHNNDIFEIFIHETDNLNANNIKAMEKVIELAHNRGIRFDYAQNNIIERM